MSIKNRHTMAAFLVAILCITIIFSALPVVSYAACSHPEDKLITYYLYLGDMKHLCETVCFVEGCEETVANWEESCSYGYCKCGEYHESPTTTTSSSSGGSGSNPVPSCEHPESREYWVNKPSTSVTHTRYVYCGVCDVKIDTVYGVDCTFNSSGRCSCGNEKQTSVTTTSSAGGSGANPVPGDTCSHPASSVMTYYSPDFSGSHRIDKVCLLCEEYVLFNGHEDCSLNSNNICIYCDWEMANCSHQNKVDVSYSAIGDGTHIVNYYCYSCYTNFKREVKPCYLVNGRCTYCNEVPSSSSSGCKHTNTITYYSPNFDGTHRVDVVCLDCEIYLVENKESICNYTNENICEDCSFDRAECGHTGAVDKSFAYAADGRHYVKQYCYVCYKYFSVVLDDCLFVKGVCVGCGNTCPHPDIKKQYFSYKDGFHEYTEYCSACECSVYSTIEDCTYDLFRCVHCGFYQPKVGIYDGVPSTAQPAYVYKDSSGKWIVHGDFYFGGVNHLNLTGCTPYIHNKKSVELLSISSNSIVLKDLDGGPNKSNSKVVDINNITFDDSPLENGQTYMFVADEFYCPTPQPVIQFVVKNNGKSTYLTSGKTFVYSDGMTFGINIKLNTSSTNGYGRPFEVTFANIGIIPAEETYEAYGIRYFNNSMSYYRYDSLSYRLVDKSAQYVAFYDYVLSLVRGDDSTDAKQLLLSVGVLNRESDFLKLYASYKSDLSQGKGSHYNVLKKLLDGSGSSKSYEEGYLKGYDSAVRDFEGVTDGGLVEGMINGAFNSVSDSWDILNSGVSISGISVGGIVSSVVILLVVFFFIKVIAR